MDPIHWLADLLPGHDHSHDPAVDAPGPQSHLTADAPAAGQTTGLGPDHYGALAGVGPSEPSAEPTGNAFLDNLDSTMASLQASTDAYVEHMEATPTGEYGSNTAFVLGLQHEMSQAATAYDGALTDLAHASHVDPVSPDTGTVAGVGSAIADPYHAVDSMIQADTAVHSTENDIEARDYAQSTADQADASLALDEGL